MLVIDDSNFHGDEVEDFLAAVPEGVHYFHKGEKIVDKTP